ncbi:MAG: hypothetical protein K0R65_1454 [Crocinitomicaceae bacterium]|jgi:hypothetical protein|nr:hypothetical protein [Crocinitomicaceae bacterium]
MKQFTWTIFCFSLLLFSCSGNDPETDEPATKEPAEAEKEPEKELEILFDQTTFTDDQSLPLLRELGEGVCNPAEKDLENYFRPACNAKFFKLFAFRENTPMKDAFVLLVKARVHNFPIRRTFIYQREKGKLVKVNGFAANLIGMRKTASDYKDLVLRFNDEDQNHFNCVYTWRSMHYEFDRVEQINDANIKKEFQDSMNVEIHKLIETKGLQNL